MSRDPIIRLVAKAMGPELGKSIHMLGKSIHILGKSIHMLGMADNAAEFGRKRGIFKDDEKKGEE